MDLMIRKLPILLVAACAAMLAACGNTGVSQCEATGILCPVNFHCAAAEPVCISDVNLCGNAHMDPGEACDDGNTKDGDNCASDCSSDLSCGNGITDFHARIPEVCDDGGTKDGDVGKDGTRCSHDCLSKEVCGDNIVNFNEVCDDGNDIAGDGCSHQCQSNETCGNSIVDPGEACDKPGNLAECSADCKSTLACDNGTVDPGEECDVRITDSGGNVILTNSNDSDCRADCTTNRCGDGFVNSNGGGPGHLEHKEECDGAPQAALHSRAVVPTETVTCNIDCTNAKCGDGKINRHFMPAGAPGPEQCDNVMISGTTITSLDADNRDCTAACQVNRCGDGKVNSIGPAHIEQCDDGDQDDHNGCTNECKTATCGDGILKTAADMNGPAEQCDDGNMANNDGCSSACKNEFCGDNITNNGNEDCDSGQVSTATCNFNCKTPRCGDGIVNPQFKPDGTNPEQCDPPSAAMGCSATCRFEHCGNGVKDPGEECDGNDGVSGGQVCAANCHIQRCGNGIVDPNEQCDDGNNSDNDDCLSSSAAPASCKLATCGDGKRNTRTEDCDDGAMNGTLASPNHCSATCKTIACGNGVREQGEECDDGNASDNDDCISSNPDSATCKNAVCGDGKRNMRTEDCDDGAMNGTLASPNHCSATCKVVSCGNGVIEQGEQCDDGRDSLGNNNNGMGKRCNGTCQFNVCGDHDKLNGVEQCDDGNPTEGDGCDTNCTLSACGNGIKAGTETCDDGNTANGDGCDNNCTMSACGNGIKAGTETCDDGNTVTEICPYGTSCMVCDSTCHTVAGAVPACNDGNLDGNNEVCDDGNMTCGTCNSTCGAVTPATAATGVIFAAAGMNIVEGDHFVISDGAGTTINFKYTASTMTVPGTVNLPLGMDTNAQNAQNIVNAINPSGLLIDATLVDVNLGVVTLKSRLQSTTGNVAIDNQVATKNFGVFGMSGGQAGNCATGTAAANRCESNADCASARCDSTGHCAACAANADCTSKLCAVPAGRCEFCLRDSDCGTGRTCNTGTGVCSP